MVRKLLVAFGMKDDKTLTREHFGDSDFYRICWVYEDGTIEFLEDRKNTIDYEEERHGDPQKLKYVTEFLKEVDVFAGYIFGPNFVGVKRKTPKVPFLTHTQDFEEAKKKVVENFDKIYKDWEMKRQQQKSS